MTTTAALAWILENQLQSGGFFHGTSHKKKSVQHESPFFTATIIRALQSYKDDPTAKYIFLNAASFLQKQLSPSGTANYWSRGSLEAKNQPYPDDLDTTSSVLLALQHTQPEIFTGELLAQLVGVYAHTEVSEGGPYKTWLVKKNAPEYFQDVDPAVNANIVAWWSMWEVELPSTVLYLNTVLKESEKFPLASPYYVNPYPALYFLSFIANQLDQKIWQNAVSLHLEKFPPANPLEKMLVGITVLQSGCKELYDHSIIRETVSWNPETFEAFPFIKEPTQDKKPAVAGSTDWTAALWLQLAALKNASSHFSKKNSSTVTKEKNHFAIQTLAGIVDIAKKNISEFPEPIKTQAEQQLKEAEENGSLFQLGLFPTMVSQLFHKKIRDEKLLIQLGTATIYGWFSYTLYDHILDNDENPARLGLANIWNRLIGQTCYELEKTYSVFETYPTQILQNIDAANTWEFLHCRFQVGKKYDLTATLPDFENLDVLAQKSFGHALGPLSILIASGHASDQNIFHTFESFWKAYLIAKQLNDDAHDWLEDFSSGRHTPVTLHLLNAYKKKYSGKKIISFKILKKQLSQLFLQTEIIHIMNTVQEFLHQARSDADKLEDVLSAKDLKELLQPLQNAVDKAHTEHKRSHDFLKSLKL